MRVLSSWTALLSLSLVVILSIEVAAGGVLAIDYGTDFMKLALVKPGVFDIVLDKDSKRKIQSVVGFKGTDRTFGGDAAALATRSPHNSFAGVKLILGREQHSPFLAQHDSLFGIPVTKSSRNTIQFTPSGGNQSYRPEELIAMQLAYAKDLADAMAGEKVTDVVATVPHFWTQFQRQAMLDAIDLAGFKCLGLVDDGAAVAVNYAMMRSFSVTERHIVYDAGAGSIRATVASFITTEQPIHPQSKTLKNVTTIEVLGVGWQDSLGGWLLDEKLRDILRNDFEDQHKTIKLKANARAMSKLLKEAVRVKQVLSANTESVSRIEGLTDDIDFKTSVSRQRFEEAFADQTDRFTQPILDALKRADLTMDQIDSVILVGGSSRVPWIQNALKSLAGEGKVAVNVNADESFVMGAALYGAWVSRQFKTKDIRLLSRTAHNIHSEHEVENDSDEGTGPMKTVLFSENSKTGVKKTIKLQKTSDFSLLFTYPSSTTQKLDMLNVTVTGLEAALKNHSNATGADISAQNVSVTVSVELSESSILLVPQASVTLPTGKSEEPSLTSRIAGLFNGKTSTDTDGDDAEQESKESDTVSEPPLEGKDKLPDKKVDYVTFPLTISQKYLGPSPMTAAEKLESKKILRELKSIETRQRLREEARNSLEAYTYKLRDRLESTGFTDAMTKTELNSLTAKRDDVTEWLSVHEETATLKEIRGKKLELETMVATVMLRLDEAKTRPEAFKQLESSLDLGSKFLDLIRSAQLGSKPSSEAKPADGSNVPSSSPSTTSPLFTTEEITEFDNLITKIQKWYDDKKVEQSQLELWQDPGVKTFEIQAQAKQIDNEVSKLSRKMSKPPTKPKAKVKPSTTTTTTTATSSSPTSTSEDGEQGGERKSEKERGPPVHDGDHTKTAREPKEQPNVEPHDEL